MACSIRLALHLPASRARREKLFPRLFQIAAENGIAGVEFPASQFIFDRDDSGGTADLQEDLKKNRLAFVGLHSLFEPHPSLSLFGGEGTIKQARESVRSNIKLCQELGGNIVTVGSPDARRFASVLKPDAAMQMAVDFFQSLIPICESRGVTLAVDILPPHETDFATSLQDGKRLVKAVGHTRFRMAFNMACWSASGESFGGLAGKYLPYLAHIHMPRFEGAQFQLGGVGPAMVRGQELAAAGYRGWVSLQATESLLRDETLLVQCLQRFRRWLE